MIFWISQLLCKELHAEFVDLKGSFWEKVHANDFPDELN